MNIENQMNVKENQIIAQYAMLNDKIIEIENEFKAKKERIDQEINIIEAYNNIFLHNEHNEISNISTTERDSESIIRIAPILEPAFFNENCRPQPLPIQISDNIIQQSNIFEMILLATQPLQKNISLIDIHTFPNLVCIGSDGLLRIYNILDGSIFLNWDVSIDSYENNVTCLTNVPKHNCIGIGFEDGFVRILNSSSVVISEFPVSNEPLSSIYFSSKNVLFCYAKNGEISCWKGESNCLQTNIFSEPFLSFKDINDPSTLDIYIISTNSKIYRWELEKNSVTLIEQNQENYIIFSENQNKNASKLSITAEEKQIKISSSQRNDDSSDLQLEVPEYSHFDQNDSYFCFSIEARFFIYKIKLKDNINSIRIKSSIQINVSKRENFGNTEESNNSSLNIDNYMIGNVDKNSIQNMASNNTKPK